MTKIRHKTKKYTERQSALVDVAIRLINRQGVNRLTLIDVAEDMGLGPKSVAYYFKKKEDLAAASFLRGLELFQNLVQECEAEPSPAQRITCLFDIYFEFKRRAAVGQGGDLISPNDIRALNSAKVNEAYITLFRQVRGLFEQPDRSNLTKLALNARSHLVIAELNWTPAWLRNVFPEEYSRVGARAADILLNGMAAPGSTWSPLPLSLHEIMPDQSNDSASESFIRASTKIINVQGYDGASVEKISAVLSLSKGAFYHHIKTKDELIMACFDRTFDFLQRAIIAAESIDGNGLQRLQTLAFFLVQLQVSGKSVILGPAAVTTLPVALQANPLGDFDRIALRLSGVISDGITDGSIRAVDPNVAANMFIGMVNMSSELSFFVPGISLDQAIDHYVLPSFSGGICSYS